MSVGVVRVVLKLKGTELDGISGEMVLIVSLQEVEIGPVEGEQLEPQFAHLVARLESVGDANGRLVWIADILGRIVVGVAHGEASASGQKDGDGATKIALPIEIPVFDEEETPGSATGEGCECFHAFGKVMGMGQEAEQFHIDGQGVTVLNAEGCRAGGNVDGVGTETYLEWSVSRRNGGKIKSDGGLDRLGLAGGLHMQLQNEIEGREEGGSEAFGHLDWAPAGLPAYEVAAETFSPRPPSWVCRRRAWPLRSARMKA